MRGTLLSVLAGAGALHVAYVWMQSPATAAQAGIVALGALAGYIMLGGWSVAPAVRRPLLGGVLVLMVVVSAGALWPFESTVDWTAVRSQPAERTVAAIRDSSERWNDRQRWLSFGTLVMAGCLAAAVFALPGRDRPRLAAVSAAVGALLVGVTLSDAWHVAGGDSYYGTTLLGRLADVAAAAAVPLLAAMVALGAAVIAGQRAGAGRLATVGAVLVAVYALTATSDAVHAVPTLWSFAEREAPGFMQSGVMIATDTSRSDPAGALVAAALLLGVTLVVVGTLRITPPLAAAGAPPDRPDDEPAG